MPKDINLLAAKRHAIPAVLTTLLPFFNGALLASALRAPRPIMSFWSSRKTSVHEERGDQRLAQVLRRSWVKAEASRTSVMFWLANVVVIFVRVSEQRLSKKPRQLTKSSLPIFWAAISTGVSSTWRLLIGRA
jgi:hypothetical protein